MKFLGNTQSGRFLLLNNGQIPKCALVAAQHGCNKQELFNPWIWKNITKKLETVAKRSLRKRHKNSLLANFRSTLHKEFGREQHHQARGQPPQQPLHLIQQSDAHELTQIDSFWPRNVVHWRFYLYEEARSWLRSFPPDSPMIHDENWLIRQIYSNSFCFDHFSFPRTYGKGGWTSNHL